MILRITLATFANAFSFCVKRQRNSAKNLLNLIACYNLLRFQHAITKCFFFFWCFIDSMWNTRHSSSIVKKSLSEITKQHPSFGQCISLCVQRHKHKLYFYSWKHIHTYIGAIFENGPFHQQQFWGKSLNYAEIIPHAVWLAYSRKTNLK